MPNTQSRLDRAISSHNKNFDDEPRKIGIEIEFAGLSAEQILECMDKTLTGTINWASPFEVEFVNDELGTFKLELDSAQIKELGVESPIEGDPSDAEPSVHKTYIQTISKMAENLVPWEIVSPPLELRHVSKLYALVDRLRAAGALGTKSAMRYAFGVHLNPEPASLSPKNLVQHLQSFFCLYDWIVDVGDIDIARRITPYINHFKKDYILQVLDREYRPDQTSLVEDYLIANPTRNRSLDMLPMFAYLDEGLVGKYVDDDRVKARPTFHYRLPNCEIDDPEWNLNRAVEIWLLVEELARDSDTLTRVCGEYQRVLTSILPTSSGSWVKRLNELVDLPAAEDFKVAKGSA